MIANVAFFPPPPEVMNPGGSCSGLKQAIVYSVVAILFAICVIIVNDVRNRLQSYEPDRVLYYTEILGFFGTLWLLDQISILQYVLAMLMLYTSGLLGAYGTLMISRAIGLLVFYPYLNFEGLNETVRCALEMSATLLSFTAVKLRNRNSNVCIFLAGQPIPLLVQSQKGILL